MSPESRAGLRENQGPSAPPTPRLGPYLASCERSLPILYLLPCGRDKHRKTERARGQRASPVRIQSSLGGGGSQVSQAHPRQKEPVELGLERLAERAFCWSQLDKCGLGCSAGSELPVISVMETEPRGAFIGVVFQRSD